MYVLIIVIRTRDRRPGHVGKPTQRPERAESFDSTVVHMERPPDNLASSFKPRSFNLSVNVLTIAVQVYLTVPPRHANSNDKCAWGPS